VPSITNEYAHNLALLEGDHFQQEVSAFLASAVLGFQVIPAKPQGDAGLDGFSHNGERGYCCYGPEHDQFKQTRSRVSAIVKKFSSDLRRLYELDVKNRKLALKQNVELGTILPKGQKLKCIYLLVNWFESHRVIGPINTAAMKYAQMSACRYVDPGAVVTIMGPAELTNWYPIDEGALLRIQQRTFMKKVQQTAKSIVIGNPKDFEAKMQILREIRPDQLSAIERLSQELRDNWRTALAFDAELDKTVPRLHEALEASRHQITVRVSQLMLSSPEPWTQLENAHSTAEQVLYSHLGRAYGTLVPDVSSGEVARLIGECPVGWKKRNTNG
jgi:hypothetical protein